MRLINRLRRLRKDWNIFVWSWLIAKVEMKGGADDPDAVRGRKIIARLHEDRRELN